MRIFYAIIPPEEIQNQIYTAALRLYPAHRTADSCGLSVVKPENLHITLKFIGEVEGGEKLLQALGGVIEKAIDTRLKNCPPPEIKVTGFGCFPSQQDEKCPRVVWAGISPEGGGAEFLATLAESISEGVRETGITSRRTEETFVPHITIARIKKISSSLKEVKNFLSSPPDLKVGFLPDGISLVESCLMPGGPRYRTILFKPFYRRPV